MLQMKVLQFSDFSSLVGSSFHVHTQSSALLQLELEEATKIGDRSAAQNKRTESFALLFKGPSARVLPQKTYSLTHSQLGNLRIFLVPVKQDADGMRYEAIFN